MEETETAVAVVQRDEKGRLLPGSKLAAGIKNPQAALRLQLHSAFLAAVGTDRLTDVINRHLELIQEAKPREAAALIELLYQYCLGKPMMTVVQDTTTNEAAPSIKLDQDDLAALERMRSKISTEQGDS